MHCRIVVLLVALVSSAATSAASAQVTLNSDRKTRSIYHGVEQPTQWQGDTDVIDLDLDKVTLGSAFTMISKDVSGDRFSETTGPIRLIDAQRKASTYSVSAVYDNPADVGKASEGDITSSSEEGRMSQWGGVYAQVINEQDELLARGEAFSTIDSEITHTFVSASGTLGVDSFVEPRLRDPRTKATGSATAVVEASYEVSEEMHFLLDATLSGTAGLDLSLQIIDLDSLENVLSETLQPGMQQRIEHCGILSPGRYRIELAGSSNAIVEAGESPMARIDGAYDLSFHAHRVATGPVTEYQYDPISSILAGGHFEVLVADSMTIWTSSVPEPSSNLMLLGLFVLVPLMRRSR